MTGVQTCALPISNIDKARAIIFSPYATQEAQDFFENRKRRDGIKEKFNITGTITGDKNIEKLKKMSKEEFEIYTAQYAKSTMKTINRKMEKVLEKKDKGSRSLEAIFGGNQVEKKSLEEIFR